MALVNERIDPVTVLDALKKRGVGRGGAMQNLFFYLTVLMQ